MSIYSFVTSVRRVIAGLRGSPSTSRTRRPRAPWCPMCHRFVQTLCPRACGYCPGCCVCEDDNDEDERPTNKFRFSVEDT